MRWSQSVPPGKLGSSAESCRILHGPPGERSGNRVTEEVLGLEPEMDDPRMARADPEDELWRTQIRNSPGGRDQGQEEQACFDFRSGGSSALGCGTPTRLCVEEASQRAGNAQSSREQELMSTQLRQPEVPLAMEWMQEGQGLEQGEGTAKHTIDCPRLGQG